MDRTGSGCSLRRRGVVFWSTVLAAVALLSSCAAPAGQDAGGVLLPEQAAYDVFYYDLALTVDPEAQAIAGSLTAHAAVREPLDRFVLDLDPRLDVERVAVTGEDETPLATSYRLRGGRLWIALPEAKRPGDSVQVTVAYGGRPRVAPNPPWEGGFTWAETPGGEPWIATSCQTAGADLWWPVKDHPSDEPDSMAIRVTVPAPLVAASNGRLRRVEDAADGARTYHWFVSTPINTYGVALNVAPYERIDTSYASIDGTRFPVAFWVLPQDTSRLRRALPGYFDQLRFLEKMLGPYPFRADKYGVAQAPFLGMEHQTLIAYGGDFQSGGLGYDQGFDALHLHELAHEWFGNLVTAADWKDFWLHEGFATYLEALYAEHLHGEAAYHNLIGHFRTQVEAERPIARRAPTSAGALYGRDVYNRGALVLHTLRYLIGDEAFFEALRRMAYPTEAHRQATGGRQTRLVATEEFVRIAEEAAGRELDWFFETYLYHADLPRLVAERTGRALHLRWDAPGDEPFPMPVPVQVGGEVRRVTMPEGAATLALEEAAADVTLDPDRWILKAAPR